MEVSIITPTYNSEKFIESTAKSVLNQTFKDWEWVIVDDCSTDRTKKILEQLVKSDNRIKYFPLDKNSGSGPARNKAIELASGKYIAFLDSDDIWSDRKLEVHIEFMKKNNYILSHTSYGFIDENNKVIKGGVRAGSTPITHQMMFKKNHIGCLTAVYDQEVLGKMFMPDVRQKQDYALWLSIMKKGFKSYPLEKELAFYRKHSGSVTNNKLKLIFKHWLFLKEYENMNWVNSTFYTICWGLNGILKHYISPFRTKIHE